MGMPTDLGIIDLMMGIPDGDRDHWYQFLKPQLRDAESRDEFEFPAQYMFKEVPEDPDVDDPVKWVLEQMDRFGIEKAMIGIGGEQGRALKEHPDRFIPSTSVDPNRGMDAVRDLVRDYETWGVKSAQWFPAGCNPQVPIDDKRAYPIYAKCIELDIPIFVCVGVPGPRVPMACQHVELIDEVCWFFPELKFVIRHGAEPWTDLAVKLMLKWPNLYYSTSAFAPRYYPKAIIDFANTRGADKIMYAGYFPMGLSLDRIFSELPTVPFSEDVWPKFLRDNARKVLKLDD
ncbi:MAG: amidohydrolase family protein [Acidimicrobiales bacterium]|nr:amidohydrolase family protein [Acidimicrobiales bacterium]